MSIGSYTVDLATVELITTIAQQEYDMHMAEIMALPLKKRKKWKARLTDKFGVTTRCVYRDGDIWNWSLITHRWAKVKPHGSVMNDRNEEVVWMPNSVVGDIVCSGADDESITAAVQLEAAYNHTGNHTRSNTVKVPPQSDGRVRG